MAARRAWANGFWVATVATTSAFQSSTTSAPAGRASESASAAAVRIRVRIGVSSRPAAAPDTIGQVEAGGIGRDDTVGRAGESRESRGISMGSRWGASAHRRRALTDDFDTGEPKS